MKKRIVVLLCATLMAMSACGQNKNEEVIPTAPETATETDAATESSAETEPTTDEKPPEIDGTDKAPEVTEQEALDAIKKYLFLNNPDLEEMAKSDDYNIYWEVTTNDEGMIVVLYRSYTGSENRYYIVPENGETYGTELVPGIIDEEQRTEEQFNIWDYINGDGPKEPEVVTADPERISKEIEEIVESAGSLKTELIDVNWLYDKYDELRMYAQDQTSMNELSKIGTMVWKTDAESLLKRIEETDPNSYQDIKSDYDQWEKYVPVMAERMSYLYEDGSIYPMEYAYNEAMRYKEKAYHLTEILAELGPEEFFGFPDSTRCGYYGDYTGDSYLIITEGMESGSYNILIHFDDTKELRGRGEVEDAPDADTYLLFTSDDETVKGYVAHSAQEASLYVTETDYSVVGPEGAWTFPVKY